MNAKEAINILAKMQNYDSKRNVEALEIAISALKKVETLEAENARLREKETAKKFIKKQPYMSVLHCPTCNDMVSEKQAPHYCPECGQHFDWSSDKE